MLAKNKSVFREVGADTGAAAGSKQTTQASSAVISKSKDDALSGFIKPPSSSEQMIAPKRPNVMININAMVPPKPTPELSMIKK